MIKPYDALKEIGNQLDQDIFPRIKDGGLVTPSDTASPTLTWAKENEYEEYRKRRSETRPWTGTAGGERETRGCRSSSATAPSLCTGLQNQYEDELTAIQQAYPNTRVWQQPEGLWLLTESLLLPGLWQKALFLTGIPFSKRYIVRSWGFWMGIPLANPSWIGPRHTNLPDGSVCAFEPRDGTWKLGDSLVTLIDLYTLWALRHLHLQVFHRWPGRQVAHFVHERLTEIKQDEFCGCGSDRNYGDCCQNRDLNSNRLQEAIRFIDFGVRTPPKPVTDFILTLHPPKLLEVLPKSKIGIRGDISLEIGSH